MTFKAKALLVRFRGRYRPLKAERPEADVRKSAGKADGCASNAGRSYSVAIRTYASRWLNNRIWRFCAIGFLTVVVWLCSCDGNLLGRESKELAGGYRLKRADNPNQFVLTIPNENGGLIIDEIGWHEPLIIARASGSQYWDVINTAHAQHTRVSDLERKSDPVYQSIQIRSAETAWKDLTWHKRLW